MAKEDGNDVAYKATARASTSRKEAGGRTLTNEHDDTGHYEGDGVVADDEDY